MDMKQQRNTRQRQLVLDEVRSRRDHPTAEQIFQNVHALDPHISRGTVYRNLNLLCDNQEIFRVVMSDCDRFDLRTDPHYHMRCVVCGCVLDVDSPYDREYDAALAQKTGYQILRHRLVVEGICPDCQKKKPAPDGWQSPRKRPAAAQLSQNTSKAPLQPKRDFFAMQKHSKIEMCYFSAPAGQPEMMHKNFMHQHLRFSWCSTHA